MTQIYASFEDVANAEQAVGALLDNGVKAENVTLIANRADAGETAAGDADAHAKSGITTTTPADAGAGAAKGAGIGAGLGAVAAIASLFVPGIGLVVGGGALATALAGAVGATAAGAVAGGINGYLVDQGMPEAVATGYHNTLNRGGALVVVSPNDQMGSADVEETLQKYSGFDIGTY